jgi:hypothetical protein
MQGYVYGFQVSYLTAASVRIAGADSSARDDSNAYTFEGAANYDADITASGAGGLDAGAEASSTWYHVWLIAKADGTKAALLSLSSTSPTMPSGYIYKRRIGTVRNNSASDFNDFIQVTHGPDRLTSYRNWTEADHSVNVVGVGSTYVDVDHSAHLPPTAVEAQIQFVNNTGSTANGQGALKTKGDTSVTGQILTGVKVTAGTNPSTVAWQRVGTGQMFQVRETQSVGGGNYQVYVRSYSERL